MQTKKKYIRAFGVLLAGVVVTGVVLSTGLSARAMYYCIQDPQARSPVACSGSGTIVAPDLYGSVSAGPQNDLSWIDNGDADYFQIRRSINGAAPTVLPIGNVVVSSLLGNTQVTFVNATRNLTYSDKDIICGNAYTYTVEAHGYISGLGPKSRPSNPVTLTPPCGGIPRAPTLLSVDSISQTQINVAWKDNSDNESYFVVKRGDTGAFAYPSSIPGTGTISTTASVGLNSCTKYAYTVGACNDSGCAWSN